MPTDWLLVIARAKYLIWLSVASALSSCGLVGVHSCHEPGGRVLGEDVPRIRSHDIRMKLANPGAAAERFVPYALMSTLAYGHDEDAHCRDAGMSDREAAGFEALLAESSTPQGAWQRVPEVEPESHCEDELGFYYRVWKRMTETGLDVVVAFRGTSNSSDWLYGNLHWITRWLAIRDQYTEAYERAHVIVRYFNDGVGRPPAGGKVRFFATGHSLGGGLAQGIHYALPDQFRQVFAFDPSSVTGFSDQPNEARIADCACDASLNDEVSIYRIYESSEILAFLRTPHKLFLGPPNYVQEVRFGFDHDWSPVRKHSMSLFAKHLLDKSHENRVFDAGPWYAGVGDGCTQKFITKQVATCPLPQSKLTCP